MALDNKCVFENVTGLFWHTHTKKIFKYLYVIALEKCVNLMMQSDIFRIKSSTDDLII